MVGEVCHFIAQAPAVFINLHVVFAHDLTLEANTIAS